MIALADQVRDTPALLPTCISHYLQVMKEFSEIAQPGAYLVDFLPIRMFPSGVSSSFESDGRSQIPSGLVPGYRLQANR